MGILNRLWASVWHSEEAKKQNKINVYRSEVYRHLEEETKEMAAKPTSVQEEALKMGGIEEDNGLYYAGQTTPASLYQRYIAMTQTNNMLNQLGQQVGLNTNTANSIFNQPSLTNVGTGIATVSGGHTLLGGSGASIYPSVQQMPRWPTLGTGERDAFFMALKGIEEAAMKAPEGISKYDNDAMAIQDLRYFNSQTISLIGILSFCIANTIDSHGIITLLEGYGMKLVLE